MGEYVQSTRLESLQQTLKICQIMTLHNPRHLVVDAKHLYGAVMHNENFPQSDFTLNSDITLAEILNCPDDNPVGYFVEVDLHYPASLHDYHQDFPLAHSKNFDEDDWLSDYQVNLRESQNLPPSKVPKLLQTFFEKENCVLNYKLLKLYFNLGLVENCIVCYSLHPV